MAAKRPARGTAGTPKKRARAKHDWAPAFLAAFEEVGTVIQACRRAEVGRSTVYRRRDEDEQFAADWAEIEEAVVEGMEREAWRRASEGVESHKYDKDGNLLWTETKYSDTLLMFLLKARRPRVYRERIEHTGGGGGPIQLEHDLADPKVRDALFAAARAIDDHRSA